MEHALEMSQDNVSSRLKAELEEVQRLSGADFSGVGVIVWDGSSPLPVVPLWQTRPVVKDKLLAPTLAALGHQSSPFHDGVSASVVSQIGAIARPRQVIIVPDMPKTRSGKIMRRVGSDLS